MALIICGARQAGREIKSGICACNVDAGCQLAVTCQAFALWLGRQAAAVLPAAATQLQASPQARVLLARACVSDRSSAPFGLDSQASIDLASKPCRPVTAVQGRRNRVRVLAG